MNRIRAEISEYGDDPTGQISAETQHAVHEALRAFMRGLVTGRRDSPEQDEVFRRLGQLEAEAGRSHDTLQSAYRIASQAVMEQLIVWEHELGASREVMAQVSSAVFAFIDHLATVSAGGYARAKDGSDDRSRLRSRLLAVLIQRTPARRATIDELALRAGWTPPDAAAVVHLDSNRLMSERDLDVVARALFGEQALSGRIGAHQLIVTPEPVVVDDLVLATQSRELRVTIGPRVPLSELSTSARMARRASTSDALRDAQGVLRCDDSLLELLEDAARDVLDVLVRKRLTPLLALTPCKRLKYGRLLSAWLEFGSLRGAAPGVLDKHRQTLRYQVTQLEKMFGDQLLDRTARVELTLALRAVLPRWEREASDQPDSAEVRPFGRKAGPDWSPRIKNAAVS